MPVGAVGSPGITDPKVNHLGVPRFDDEKHARTAAQECIQLSLHCLRSHDLVVVSEVRTGGMTGLPAPDGVDEAPETEAGTHAGAWQFRGGVAAVPSIIIFRPMRRMAN